MIDDGFVFTCAFYGRVATPCVLCGRKAIPKIWAEHGERAEGGVRGEDDEFDGQYYFCGPGPLCVVFVAGDELQTRRVGPDGVHVRRQAELLDGDDGPGHVGVFPEDVGEVCVYEWELGVVGRDEQFQQVFPAKSLAELLFMRRREICGRSLLNE